MPDEDLGRIWVGQLPGSGALYALPASYYEFDFPAGGGDPCPPKGGGAGKHENADSACEGRTLPASTWDSDGRYTLNCTARKYSEECCYRPALVAGVGAYTLHWHYFQQEISYLIPILAHVALCRLLASNASGFGPGVPLGIHEVFVSMLKCGRVEHCQALRLVCYGFTTCC